MANYASLKDIINNPTQHGLPAWNNDANQIEGVTMKGYLLAIIDSLTVGYQFMGVATPSTNPGTPDQRVFYIAATPGAYSNFGLTVNNGEVAILRYDTSWAKLTTGIAPALVGYQYMGVATPTTNPGTPEQKVFYLASQPGAYTNFGGLVVNDGEVCALVYSTSWSKHVTGAATALKVFRLEQEDIRQNKEISGYTLQDSVSVNSGNSVFYDIPISSGERYSFKNEGTVVIGLSTRLQDRTTVVDNIGAVSVGSTIEFTATGDADVIRCYANGNGTLAFKMELISATIKSRLQDLESSAVKFTKQTLTEGEKSQTLSNLGIAGILKDVHYTHQWVAREGSQGSGIILGKNDVLRVKVNSVSGGGVNIFPENRGTYDIINVVSSGEYVLFGNNNAYGEVRLYCPTIGGNIDCEISIDRNGENDKVVALQNKDKCIDDILQGETYDFSEDFSIVANLPINTTDKTFYVNGGLRKGLRYKLLISSFSASSVTMGVVGLPASNDFIESEQYIPSPAVGKFIEFVPTKDSTHITLRFTTMSAVAGTFDLTCNVSCYHQYPESESDFVNSLALPSKLYFLSNAVNNIYKLPVIKRDLPNYILRYNALSITHQYRDMVELTSPANNSELVAKLYKMDEDVPVVVANKTIQIRAADANSGAGNVYCSMFGDSWLMSNAYIGAMFDNVPGVHLVGRMDTNPGGSSGVYAGNRYEGISGTSAGRLASVTLSTMPSPIYHPQSGVFWGNVAFWKLVKSQIESQTWAEPYAARCVTMFNTYFDPQTCTLLSPQLGDIFYDNTGETYGLGAQKFVRYNGTSWEVIASLAEQDTLNWGIDYVKYYTRFQTLLGNLPDYLIIMLGVNDWKNVDDIPAVEDYFNTTYKVVLNKLISDFKSINPSGKILVNLSCTTFGWLDNYVNGNAAGNFTAMENAKAFKGRELVLEEYDNRESEGIYIVDSGSMIDNDFGYGLKQNIKPFNLYNGSRLLVTQNEETPHPSASYQNAGIPIAAIIQYTR